MQALRKQLGVQQARRLGQILHALAPVLVIRSIATDCV
jgi:hypothetical protein